jgi:hypothetical protein
MGRRIKETGELNDIEWDQWEKELEQKFQDK